MRNIERNKKILEMRDNGATNKEIAERFCMSTAQVSVVIRKRDCVLKSIQIKKDSEKLYKKFNLKKYVKTGLKDEKTEKLFFSFFGEAHENVLRRNGILSIFDFYKAMSENPEGILNFYGLGDKGAKKVLDIAVRFGIIDGSKAWEIIK